MILIKTIIYLLRRCKVRAIMLLIRFHGRPSRLKKAIKVADEKHAKDGKRYRVFFLARRYHVLTRNEIKAYKKAGVFRRYINSTNIDPTKFYDTNPMQSCS